MFSQFSIICLYWNIVRCETFSVLTTNTGVWNIYLATFILTVSSLETKLLNGIRFHLAIFDFESQLNLKLSDSVESVCCVQWTWASLGIHLSPSAPGSEG